MTPNLTPIELHLDYPQKRLVRPPNVVLALGSYESATGRPAPGWDYELSTDWWQEPVTLSAMQKPNILYSGHDEEMVDTFHYKVPKAAITFADSAKWVERGYGWLEGRNLANEGGVTTTSFAEGQGFACGFHLYGDGQNNNIGYNTEYLAYSFFYGDSRETSSFALDIFLNGRIEVHTDEGVTVGSLSAAASSAQQTDAQKVEAASAVAIIQGKTGEVLILTTGGGSFSVPYSGTIGSTKFGFKVWGTESSGLIRLVPIQYTATPGPLISVPLSFRKMPVFGVDTLLSPRWVGVNPDRYSATLVGSDGSSAYAYDTLLCRVRINHEVGTSAYIVPSMVYFAIAGFNGYAAFTSDSPLGDYDFTPFRVDEATLSVPDDGAATLNFTLGRIPKMPEPYNTTIAESDNRPVRLRMGDVSIFAGRGRVTQYSYIRSNELASRCTIEAADPWAALERIMFDELIPFDGMQWSDVLLWILSMIGYSDVDVSAIPALEDIDYALPISNKSPSGEFAFAAQPGDTAATLLRQLFTTNAGTWLYDFSPTAEGYRFRIFDPETFGAVNDVKYTLYEKAEDALAAATSDEEELLIRQNIAQFTYRDVTLQPKPRECTEIRITGQNPVTRELIQGFAVDYAAQDPSTPVENRINWIGEPWTVVLRDPLFTSYDEVVRGMDILKVRLWSRRVLVSWRSSLLIGDAGIPLWRGDVVHLSGLGMVRILSFEAVLKREPNPESDDWLEANTAVRPTTYVGQLLATELDWSSSLNSGLGRVKLMGYRLLNQLFGTQVDRRGGEQLKQRTPRTIFDLS